MTFEQRTKRARGHGGAAPRARRARNMTVSKQHKTGRLAFSPHSFTDFSSHLSNSLNIHKQQSASFSEGARPHGRD